MKINIKILKLVVNKKIGLEFYWYWLDLFLFLSIIVNNHLNLKELFSILKNK